MYLEELFGLSSSMNFTKFIVDGIIDVIFCNGSQKAKVHIHKYNLVYGMTI